MGATSEQRDGRTVRAERTRQALVDSLLGLLDEGHLTPTAAAIAARAGVSERSVFQHFPDREGLLEAVAREQYERVVPTLHPVDSSVPLPERIEQFTQQRVRLYELIGGVRRAGLLIEHESSSVAGWLATARQAKAAEVERVFRRELDAIPADEREPLRAALITLCSWSAWDSWRTHQGLSVARSRAAMAAGIGALLGQR
ncbi:MAG: TetR/AcrR family transcriptional regulator, regulator of autoinduction and epiphytic fitness [Thermoleophilaceae bacterium]|jgi:AcrR family transcriptional regulator|nr:TetR/AcrR family transcriptional regulator, regulator of autoinduction and epiphytic fitness [Thermoleophilaceae bacterium]